jgi:hypothetical protein
MRLFVALFLLTGAAGAPHFICIHTMWWYFTEIPLPSAALHHVRRNLCCHSLSETSTRATALPMTEPPGSRDCASRAALRAPYRSIIGQFQRCSGLGAAFVLVADFVHACLAPPWVPKLSFLS